MDPEKLNELIIANVRFWGRGEIAQSAWKRIESLRHDLKRLDAEAMIQEWVIC